MLQWHTGHDFLECIPHDFDKGRIKLRHLVNSLAEPSYDRHNSEFGQKGGELSAFSYLRTVGAKVFPKALLT